ncbi:MAG: site-2 protease family protein [Victivallaceae bacterium]|nr:site-2 protease family protein [Victivallaceae bacterium]
MESLLENKIILGILATLFMLFFGGFCVFIHELGHFLAAKWRGLHIVAFSLGFKKAWSKTVNGIDYRIGWLPFGGYVDLPQIDTTQDKITTEDGKELEQAKPLDRMITAFAGPFFNILFGLALGCVIWVYGVPQRTPKMRAIVVEAIDKTSPEFKAGLRAGDKIVKIDGSSFYCTWEDFVQQIIFTIGEVDLKVDRNGKEFDISYVAKENPNAPGALRREKIAYPFFLPRIPIIFYPDPEGPARQAGVRNGDVLVSMNSVKIYNFASFYMLLNNCDGKPIKMTVLRKGENITLDVTPIIDTSIPEKDSNIYLIGVSYNPVLPITVSGVNPGYPAAMAGLKSGDVIEKIDGKSFENIKLFIEQLNKAKNSGKRFPLTIKRGDKTLEIELQAKKIEFYTIKTQLSAMDYPTPIQQFVRVIDLSYKSLRSIAFWVMNKTGVSKYGSTIKPSNLSGPIGMGRTIYLSIYRGTLRHGIFFIVLISFALAIFNLLPLPVLDGGHITVAGIEMITRRPLHKKSIEFLNIIFVALLVSLMVYVTFYDILRFMGLKEATTEKAENWEFSNVEQTQETTEKAIKPAEKVEPLKSKK